MGLEIYGISLDTNKNDWVQALNEDQPHWIEVNDWNNKIAISWQVKYIPDTFLVDQEGRIIAHNLNKDQLYEFLKNKLL